MHATEWVRRLRETKAARVENCVLAVLLWQRGAERELLPLLDPADFDLRLSRATFLAIRAVQAEGGPVDVLTVADRLHPVPEFAGLDCLDYLAWLTEKAESPLDSTG